MMAYGRATGAVWIEAAADAGARFDTGHLRLFLIVTALAAVARNLVMGEGAHVDRQARRDGVRNGQNTLASTDASDEHDATRACAWQTLTSEMPFAG